MQHHSSTCYIHLGLTGFNKIIVLKISAVFYLFHKEVGAADDECQCVDQENIDRCYDRNFFLDDYFLSVSPCLFMETEGNSILA